MWGASLAVHRKGEKSMSQTILIADDDRDHLFMLAFKLRKAGYNVISAFDAKHAMQMAVEQAPDLLLLDIHLGDEEGFAIQQRLSQLDEMASTPVIYLTGDASASVQVLAESLGAYAVVIKPFNHEALLDAVAGALTQTPDSRTPVAASTDSTPPLLRFAEAYIG
jgi:DNA-binding response OmpR family regulator